MSCSTRGIAYGRGGWSRSSDRSILASVRERPYAEAYADPFQWASRA